MSKKTSPLTEVTINGEIYDLNLNKAIEDGSLKKRFRRKIGQIYFIDSQFYILAACRGKYCLVCIHDGLFWMDPVSVVDPCNISQQEWRKITNDHEVTFVANNFRDYFKYA